jgi:GT2 family glycosyltransferase
MIYIVIPVHNRKELTRACLGSLRQQDNQNFKVIIVDDGSNDGTDEMIMKEFPEIVYLRGDGDLWWAGAINRGIRYALNICQPDDYILTLNNDLVVRPDYVSSLYSAIEKHPGSIVGSVETTAKNPDIIRSGGILVNWSTVKESNMNRGRSLSEFPKGHFVSVCRLTGRGTLYPKSVFDEVGFFDEVRIKQCADTELPVRASFRFGYLLLVSYDAVVISAIDRKDNINTKATYTLGDIGVYFFDIRSHFNLMTRYWLARSIAPNNLWFIRYLIIDVLRTTGHFVVRFRLRSAH